MNLGLCIASLLRRYPTVEVPGIGVFKVTHVPASFGEDKATLYPPETHVELTEEGEADFSILTYLQVQRGVDPSVAAGMLERAIDETMETITRNGRALLDGLGYLLADGASFVFRPFEAEGKGRKSVNVPLLPDDTEKEVAEALPLAEEEEEAKVEVEEDIEERGGGNSAKWMIAAVLFLLLSGVGLAWFYQPAWFGSKQASKPQRAEQPHQPNPTGQVDVTAAATDSALVDSAQRQVSTVDAVRSDSVPSVPPPSKPSVTYEIIVGSFATMAQADKFVTEMKAKGYDLHALDSRMPGNRKKISWGSFATEEEAYRELARVQKNFEPGAWIAKVEHE